MAGRRAIAELLYSSNLALTHAGKAGDMQAALAPYGYGPERLAAGFALRERLYRLYLDHSDQHAARLGATNNLREKAGAARGAYLRHVKLARVVFKPGSAGYDKLELKGDRLNGLVGWTAQARRFYLALAGDAALQAEIGALLVDAPAVAAAQAALDAVEAARVRQSGVTAEAKATRLRRDEAAAVLRAFMRDFFAVADVVLAGRPGLREALGMVVRS